MAVIEKQKIAFLDGSKLITESLVRAGADVFIGYPITPANNLYLYGTRRFPEFYAAPDEITTLQWMSGFSAAGKVPVTATSYPGYALMIESINMAYMMELPMVIVLIQRLGPATGTATCGAQGDLAVVNGTISGGFPLPTFSVSNIKDCWDMPVVALKMAIELRTPVILLTSKEEVMTLLSVDISQLQEIVPVQRNYFTGDGPYIPYEPKENLVPEFLPLRNAKKQVRITASTHDKKGLIQSTSDEGLNNSKRLGAKITKNLKKYLHYEYNDQKGADTLLVSFGITAHACREAIDELKKTERKTSLLILKTLLPVSPEYFVIMKKYARIVVAEENETGLLRQLLFGINQPSYVAGVNSFGRMIEPEEIINTVMSHG